MTINYLLIKRKDDFITNKDQFKSFLSSNSRLKVADSCITFKNTEINYSIGCNDIEWKKNEETVINFEVRIEDDSKVGILEQLDNLILRLSSPCGDRIVINTVWDDISTYYAQRLYPSTVLIENLLRKIIYKFMIKIAGSAWFESSSPKPTKDAIMNNANKNDEEDVFSNQLYYADFIHLSSFLFDPYCSKRIDSNLINELRELMNKETVSKESINSLIEVYEPKSNWDRYFAKRIHIKDLAEKWRKLYGYRNAVAHAKRIREKDYKEAIKIVDELKKAFEDCLNQIDTVEMTEEESEVVQKVAKTTVPMENDYNKSYLKVLNDSGYMSFVPSALSNKTLSEYIAPVSSILNSMNPEISVLGSMKSEISLLNSLKSSYPTLGSDLLKEWSCLSMNSVPEKMALSGLERDREKPLPVKKSSKDEKEEKKD